MSELPEGWAEASLVGIAQITMGQAPAGEHCNEDGNGLPFFQGKAEFKKLYPEIRKFCFLPTKTAEKDDILLSIRAPVGPTNLAPENCCIGRGLAGIRAHEPVHQKYLLYFFRHIEPWLSQQGTGSTFKAINGDQIRSLAVPLAPQAEQTRIAAKLDELLAQVDTLKARIDGIPALLKRFRQSVLAAAVSGRLTEEWRGSNPVSESAEEYLARVIQSRRQHPVVKFKEPVSPDLEKREIEAPQRWIIASVSSFAECLDSMRVPVKKELRQSGEGKYPYFGANGEVDRVDEYIFDDDLVLVTEDETFYGREKPIAYKYSGKCWVNNHVHALRAHDSVARDYLCYALMHYDVIPWLTGTTGRAKLTQGALLSLPIQVPPSAEQTEIVRRVEQLFAFADQLEAKVASAKSRIDHLTQSILAKAFRGELVPQDPNDEPASVLLERIKAQRAATPKARQRRKV